MSQYDALIQMGRKAEEYWIADLQALSLHDSLEIFEELVQSTPEEWYRLEADLPIALAALYDRVHQSH